MLTVEIDVAAVEERLRLVRLACPGCAGVLAGWGRARPRSVRGPDGLVWLWPRRSRCTGCRGTHVLLPVLLLVRRADRAGVIGAALAVMVQLAGVPQVTAEFHRPALAGPRSPPTPRDVPVLSLHQHLPANLPSRGAPRERGSPQFSNQPQPVCFSVIYGGAVGLSHGPKR